MRKVGYIVSQNGEGERILHSAIVERFTTSADGALEPLRPGAALLVRHGLTGLPFPFRRRSKLLICSDGPGDRTLDGFIVLSPLVTAC